MENQTLQLVLTIIGVLGSIGLFAGGLGFLLNRFSKGSSEEKTDVISSADQLTSFWKEQVDGYKTVVSELTEKIRVLTGEIGELRGQLQSEKKQTEMLERIFQNRDPDSQKFMEHVMQSIKDQAGVNTEIVRILKEIHNMSKEEHERDFKIESTVTKQ
jgi:hypothetical protein